MNKTGRNQTVMIVDDTDDIRDLLRVQLEMLGYPSCKPQVGKKPSN